MDTVAALTRPLDEEGQADQEAIRLEFRKTRLRAPANADQFQPLIIRSGDDWQIETAPKKSAAGNNRETGLGTAQTQFLRAYDRLADGVNKTHGFDGALVQKVSTDAIRDELRTRGILPLDERNALTPAARTLFWKAKTHWIGKGTLVENEGLIWRIR